MLNYNIIIKEICFGEKEAAWACRKLLIYHSFNVKNSPTGFFLYLHECCHLFI